MAPGALLGGRYQLEDRIGAGGQGEVWRALDTALGRPVAIKLLSAVHARDRQAAARLRAEARHAALLSHPGIAWIQDYRDASESDPPFLVMELVDGPSLADVLAAGPLDAARAMDVLAQAAAGLHAAHEAGVLHQDLKPANLVFDRLGRVKITDFGIACRAASPTVDGDVVMGTPGYLAPERASGAAASVPSDLYSLGIVGYECLAGHPPFRGTPAAVAAAHRDDPLPALPDAVPAQAARLIGELTAKDPAVRPASAHDVSTRAATLCTALSGTAENSVRIAGRHADSEAPTLLDIPVKVPASRRLPRPRGVIRWRPGLTVASAAFVVLLGALASLLAAQLLTASRSQPRVPPGAAAPRHQATAGFVTLQDGSLIGLPVPVVTGQLRQLGLVVDVQWQRSSLEPAGTVISVLPAGKVAVGSIVTVTGALQATPTPASSPGDGGGHDGGTDGGGSDGGPSGSS